MFDFPASPTPGQVFNPPNGPLYTWTGTAWGAAMAPIVTADTRNRLVNGAMQISQENASTSSAVTGFFVADQWSSSFVSSSTITAQRATGNGARPYMIGMVASPPETSAAVGEYVQYIQKIEGTRLSELMLGLAISEQFIIAFDVFLPVAGTYWVCFSTNTGSYSWLGSYTIAAGETSTWVRKQVVIPAGAINAGTWSLDSSHCATVHFALHAGATFTGVAGFQAGNFVAGPGQALGLSTGSSCYLANVGLYLDPNNTGIAPPFQLPDEAQELAACQRYFQFFDFQLSLQAGAASQVLQVSKPLPTQMRTATAYSVWAAGTNVNASVYDITTSPRAPVMVMTATASGTVSAFNRVYALNARL